jgi:hypothetical protein
LDTAPPLKTLTKTVLYPQRQAAQRHQKKPHSPLEQ